MEVTEKNPNDEAFETDHSVRPGEEGSLTRPEKEAAKEGPLARMGEGVLGLEPLAGPKGGEGGTHTVSGQGNMNRRELTLEETLDEIETVLARLQQRDVPLEDSFSLYQQGIELLKQCNDKIDAVEKKMLLLQEDGELNPL